MILSSSLSPIVIIIIILGVVFAFETPYFLEFGNIREKNLTLGKTEDRKRRAGDKG